MIDRNKTKDRRRQHNSDLIRRMRNGESLNAIDSRASWFPPRPVIKKDEQEMARLYKAPTIEASQVRVASRAPQGEGTSAVRKLKTGRPSGGPSSDAG